MKQVNRWRLPLLFTLSVLGTSASLFGQCQINGVDVQNPNCCTYQVATPGNNCVAIECVAGTTGSVGNWVCANAARGYYDCTPITVARAATQRTYPTISGGMCTGTPTITYVTHQCQTVSLGRACPGS